MQGVLSGLPCHWGLADEILASTLLSWHNLRYYQSLMAAMRDAIADQSFAAFSRHFIEAQALGDIEPL